MNNIHQQYRKRRNIYFGLIAAIFGILITYGIIAPQGEVRSFSSWGKLRYCPKCGVELKE